MVKYKTELIIIISSKFLFWIHKFYSFGFVFVICSDSVRSYLMFQSRFWFIKSQKLAKIDIAWLISILLTYQYTNYNNQSWMIQVQ